MDNCYFKIWQHNWACLILISIFHCHCQGFRPKSYETESRTGAVFHIKIVPSICSHAGVIHA